MTRSVTQSWQQSSESGRERNIRVPYSRLADTTPTLHDPARITGLLAGAQGCGTVVTLDAVRSIALLNIAEGAIFDHNVRNVLTYAGAEASWGAINVGDPVYYDVSSDANNGIKLSTSPLDAGGNANPRFGVVVMFQDETGSDFPKGGITASTQECAVLQTGLQES